VHGLDVLLLYNAWIRSAYRYNGLFDNTLGWRSVMFQHVTALKSKRTGI